MRNPVQTVNAGGGSGGDRRQARKRKSAPPQFRTSGRASLKDPQTLPGTPKGNRTPVPWLRTRYPRPLDDGGTASVFLRQTGEAATSLRRRF